MSQRNRTRARDADRTAACELIEAAYADGQLSLEEHDARITRALEARTIGELRGLTDDLQGERQPEPQPPRAKRPTPRRSRLPRLRLPRRVQAWHIAVLGTALGVACIPALMLLTRGGEMLTVEGLEALVEAARDDLGSTRIDSVIVFESHAVLWRAQAGSPDRAESFTYRRRAIGGGFDEWTKSTREARETFVDLARVDVQAVIDLLERAPDLVRVDDVDRERRYLRIESADGGRIYIYLTNEFSEDGSIIASLDGEIREVDPHGE